MIDSSHSEGRLCYCGKPGCVEKSTAYPALAADIRAALDQGVFSVLNSFSNRASGIAVQDIRRALDEGYQMCMHYVKRAAGRLGVAIANMVNLLNPEMIVLYGFMLGLGDFFLSQLEASIRENVPVSYTHLDVYKRQVLGVFHIYIFEIIDIECALLYEDENTRVWD